MPPGSAQTPSGPVPPGSPWSVRSPSSCNTPSGRRRPSGTAPSPSGHYSGPPARRGWPRIALRRCPWLLFRPVVQLHDFFKKAICCWSTRISRFMRLAASSAGAVGPVPPVRRTPPQVPSRSPSGDLAARRMRLVVLWIRSKPRTSVL